MSKTFLAFDIGLSRTGVASGQLLTKSAQALDSIKVNNGQHDWPHLEKLFIEWQPSAIVIGNPHSQDRNLNKAINRFKSCIQSQHKLKVIEVDETLTTNSANSEMAAQQLSSKQKTKLRDQIAACLILESYFNSLEIE